MGRPDVQAETVLAPDSTHLYGGAVRSTRARLTGRWVHMEEVLTIRVPKGTCRRFERRAKAERLSVSQLVRRALEQNELLASLTSARTELVPQTRAQGIYTDGDVFALIS